MNKCLTHYCVAGFVFGLQTREALPFIRSFAPFETDVAAQIGQADSSVGVDFVIEQVEAPFPYSEGERLGSYGWFESECSFYRSGEMFVWNRTDRLSGELEQIAWEGEAPGLFKLYCGMRSHVVEHLVLIAFNFATLSHGALVLHSSVVEHEAGSETGSEAGREVGREVGSGVEPECRGYVFLGESGTGKSTHARLWVKHIPRSQLLNDDAPVVRVLNDAVMIYGSPWSGKGGVYRNRGVAVAGIYRLSQAPANVLTRLNNRSALAAMVHACLPPLWTVEGCADKAFDTLSGIIGRIPVFHLECLPDAGAARVACDADFSV